MLDVIEKLWLAIWISSSPIVNILTIFALVLFAFGILMLIGYIFWEIRTKIREVFDDWWDSKESDNRERRYRQRRIALRKMERLKEEIDLLDEDIRVSEANRKDDPRQK